MVIAIVFIFTTVSALGGFAWALMSYLDQKSAVDSKITEAVSLREKELDEKYAAALLEAEKRPLTAFAGPDDYGRVQFNYPRNWSVYVEKDATSGDSYVAYFNPGSVPQVSNTQQYALRLTIESKDYDKVIASYDSLVKKGDLASSSVKADDQNGTRLDGAFSKDIRGSAVIFKIRDKTVTLRTDAETFRTDFNTLVSSVTFNK